jgi:hypothetical protein
LQEHEIPMQMTVTTVGQIFRILVRSALASLACRWST